MLLGAATRSILMNQSRNTLWKAAAARSASTLASSASVASASEKTKFAAAMNTLPAWNSPQQTAFKSTAARDMVCPESLEYNVSRTYEGTNACKEVGLDVHGITNITKIHRNMTYAEMFDLEVKNKEGVVAKAEYGDTMTVYTGKYTGRSPKDKWFVRYPGSDSEKNLDWNKVNKGCDPSVWEDLYPKAVDYFNTLDTCYIFDGYCGMGQSQKKIRFVFEMAWQVHFVSNMFIRPKDASELIDFKPDFTVLNCCNQVDEDWEKHNLRTETAVVFNIEKSTAVVFGSWYGGENKKGIFSLMNYWLPMDGHLPMHCSANVGKDGDVALFFGLSGTGKTTLSADPNRALIGDDEHGWDDKGIFNFEGGCYAKTINLQEKTEPDIYRAIHRDALLENVVLTPDNVPDYFDLSITENGRVSYPIFHIDGYHKEQAAGHPDKIVFLTCDSFGVMPPIAKLTSGQAMYHFLSGYTAKVAGTERHIKEPVASFSTCFGAAFMTLHPTRYADLLQEKLDKHGCHAFLVNSGWSGGPYGEGERMSIKTTRTCIDAIMDGSIHDAEYAEEPFFGLHVPKSLPGVEGNVLDPRSTWSDKAAYDEQAKKLAQMFVDNFKQYEGVGSVDYTQYGPKL